MIVSQPVEAYDAVQMQNVLPKIMKLSANVKKVLMEILMISFEAVLQLINAVPMLIAGPMKCVVSIKTEFALVLMHVSTNFVVCLLN